MIKTEHRSVRSQISKHTADQVVSDSLLSFYCFYSLLVHLLPRQIAARLHTSHYGRGDHKRNTRFPEPCWGKHVSSSPLVVATIGKDRVLTGYVYVLQMLRCDSSASRTESARICKAPSQDSRGNVGHDFRDALHSSLGSNRQTLGSRS